MKETVHQPPIPARPPQGRRSKLGPACMAFLLVLLSAGLGLVVRTGVPAAPLAGTQEEGARPAKDYLLRDQVASPSASLPKILAHPDVIPPITTRSWAGRHPTSTSPIPRAKSGTLGNCWTDGRWF